jgi:carnitine O-palmitoyltransferase 1
LRTVRPLLDDEAYKRLTDEATKFKKGAGARFQFYLRLKWLLTSNYVSDLWEQFAYLKSRAPLICNSNIYGLESINTVWTHRPESRAANMTSLFVEFSEKLNRNELKPIMIQNSVPLCNYQYVRQFNTTRVPGEAIDKIVHLKESSHVAVFSNGKWYKLSTYHNDEKLNPKELEM